MWSSKLYLVLGCILHTRSSLAVWQCLSDGDCSSLAGSVCASGACACPGTQQIVAGGTLCADFAPYYTSTCIDDFQCSRLFTSFQCRRDGNQTAGNCFCQPNHHYFRGRCWPSTELGESCNRDEECMGGIRDPYSMSCEGQTCQCSQGYYSRQRGECRRLAAAVGERCVLDEDCQFANGACDPRNFICYDTTNPTVQIKRAQNVTHKMAAIKMAARQDGATCSAATPCPAPFECSSWSQCICPLGYYGSEDGNTCLAELGSPSSEAQCVGLLAVIENGICTCPANFFFDENMRDCVKVARRITDFCLTDEQCHSFGAAAFCGAPGQWGLRSCECDTELAVWDTQRSMCRLFAGIGESCQVDSDCMAGEQEIQCLLNDEGEGYCACPEGLSAQDGLCLTSGLELGDTCQLTQECSGTPNTVCEGGRCACDDGYREDDGFCAPTIGGSCSVNADCVIQDTTCVSSAAGSTCQCREDFVEHSDECWQNSLGYNASCTVDVQCVEPLGVSGSCQNGVCLCGANFHYRHGACWPMTGLFEACSRISECYLGDLTDTVVCRNGICQCDFNHPYSEELGICTSSASFLTSGVFIVVAAFSLHIIINK